ncbi:MAG: hypothetical protein B7Z42_11575 [Brevundimonas sp. 12-68-7]|uniref:Uncharacterized protein n=1 Tax=Brevundimonas subvibrioides TaxID=74313 RepID=A0A258FME9_9CAUL|nr:MAG: hypothetical protein B7Z42_11575 [Brevundimonas sp. 12-68-7]OYX33760.1 MAG: hypothetical protein B7Z01_08410 [Brevundimonas subvibrioides]
MTTTLIVLAFLALGVGIVAFATRGPRSRVDAQAHEQDTAWGEPPAPSETTSDPFAHAPKPDATVTPARETERQS